MSEYIQELRDVIRRRHGAEATHVESVPIKEEISGQDSMRWSGRSLRSKDHRDAGGSMRDRTMRAIRATDAKRHRATYLPD